MTKKIKFKNVKVSFSSMLNSEEKCPYGRGFKVLIPQDSPELAELKKQYKELNDLAKTKYGEKLGKKLKNAKSIDDRIQESTFDEGFDVLSFNIVRVKEKEVENEDGTTTKTKELVTDPLYRNGLNCYMVNNNGEKIFETESGKKFAPMSRNIIDLTVKLEARYSEKNNNPIINFVADEICIVESEYGKNGGSKPKYDTITLDDDEEVETKAVVKQEKSKAVKEEELFEDSELATLDV